MTTTWTPEKDAQLTTLLSDIDAREKADARRFNILHAAGVSGHREILALQEQWGCSFGGAVDRYGRELISRYYGKGAA